MEYLERDKKSIKNSVLGITVLFLMLELPLLMGVLLTYTPSKLPTYLYVAALFVFSYAITISTIILIKPQKIPFDEKAVYLKNCTLLFTELQSLTCRHYIKFYNTSKTNKQKWYFTKKDGTQVLFTNPVSINSYTFNLFLKNIQKENPDFTFIEISHKNIKTVTKTDPSTNRP